MDAEKTNEFIALVQDRPQLWQKENREFMNRDVRTKMFEELAELTGLNAETCRKKLKTLKDKMREVCNKLPKTRSGQPAFANGEQFVRWPFYQAMLFMKDQFVGREMRGTFHESTQEEIEQIDSIELATIESDSERNTGTRSQTSSPTQDLTPTDKPTQKKQDSKSKTKKTRLTEEFLSIEKAKMDHLKRVLSRQDEEQQPKDEWASFCNSVACDLRKIKDPFLIMKVKGDISKVVHDAVVQQLRNDRTPSVYTSTTSAEEGYSTTQDSAYSYTQL